MVREIEIQERDVISQVAYPYLLLRNIRGSIRVPLVNTNSWTIGRGRENAIPLPDKSMSRNHAMVQIIGKDEFYLIDLGSRNGSYVNGRRVTTPICLKSGDRLTLGESNLDFFCPELAGLRQEEDTSEGTNTMMLHKRRLITVIVVDIRNFTGLTQALDEHVLSQLIGTWFRKSGEIITRYGSWMAKYIGDAVMSVWIHNPVSGSSQVPTEEMLKPFHALYELSAMSDRLNQEFTLPFPLKVGAGMNTGYAMVGQMGTNAHPDYTALGDTVNAAFRLESATKAIGVDVALGKSTYGHTPHAIDFLSFQQHIVTLKGYNKPIVTYAGTWSNLGDFLDKITNL
jgi:adenylate cyclase